MAQTAPRFSGMNAFFVVWGGQVVSMLGTGMSRFAITLWAFQTTGEATTLALGGFFGFAPGIILSPIAGALVDRWNRKFAMMVSDLFAGLATIGLLLIVALNGIEALRVEYLYVALFIASMGEAFQFPAYSSAVSTMLPKEQYARAAGLQSIAQDATGIFAPILGGLLYASLGLTVLLVIDVVTFVAAIGALLVVHIPQPVKTEEGEASRSGSFYNELTYGFRYIFKRSSLLGLQLVFFFINLTATFAFTVLPALVLLRTATAANPDGDEVMLGVLNAVASVGGLSGGILLGVWGGPKRKVNGVLGGMIVSSLLGVLVVGLGRGPLLWAIGSFFSSFTIPVLNGSNQAIWQAKVPPDIQGKVFAVRRLIAQITVPVAMIIAGPLADNVFLPGMLEGGSLAPMFGWLVGTGPGAGISLMFVIAGILGCVVGFAGYLFPAVRDAETILPDHVQAVRSDA